MTKFNKHNIYRIYYLFLKHKPSLRAIYEDDLRFYEEYNKLNNSIYDGHLKYITDLLTYFTK